MLDVARQHPAHLHRRPQALSRVGHILASFTLLPLLVSICSSAQSVGVFEGHGDVGKVLHAGSTTYDPAKGTYTVTGSGDNLWFTADEMQFAWKRIHGDVALTAAIDFVGDKGNNHRKAALMIRQSLDASSPYADVARHGDGLTSLQFRLKPGDVTREVESSVTAPQWVRIEKRAGSVYVYVGNSPDAMHYSGAAMQLAIHGDFYVGLAVCSHDKNVTETAIFRQLKIESLPADAGQAKLWSTLETVKAASSDRRVAYTAPEHLAAPRWSKDGAAIIFAHDAVDQHFDLDPAPYPSLSVQAAFSRQPTSLGAPPPADAKAVAPDGNWVYYSSTDTRPAQLWRMHPDGSASEQMLTDGTDDLAPHPSPDGKWLVYLSFPMGSPHDVEQPGELRLLSLADRTSHLLGTLLAGPQTLAEPAWSPDSARIAFISYSHLP